MNGREFFKRYEKLINICVKSVQLLPINFREVLFGSLRNMPGKCGMFLRYVLLATLAKHIGQNVVIFPMVFFKHLENLSLGNNVSIHPMCYVDAEGGIEIGNDVSIAHRTTILSSNHTYTNNTMPIKYQPMSLAKTVIHDNVWIGCGCVLLAGVEVGRGGLLAQILQ